MLKDMIYKFQSTNQIAILDPKISKVNICPACNGDSLEQRAGWFEDKNVH